MNDMSASPQITDEEETPPKVGYVTKVYIVHQRLYAVRRGKRNTIILAAKLRQSDAQKIVDDIPGTFIEKVFATKD